MNNMYVRSKRSVTSISLIRIIFMIPIILYGFYKNGISLYINHYCSILNMFKPFEYIIIGLILSLIINVIFEVILNKNNHSKIFDKLLSSSLIEYSIILGSLVSINTNIIIYTICIFIGFILIKLVNNKLNIVSLLLIVIYFISIKNGNYSYSNVYELGKTFNLDFMDYFIGNYPGGIYSTSIVFTLIALIGMYLSNNNKTVISIYSYIAYCIVSVVISLVFNYSYLEMILSNSVIYMFTYVLTNYYTSPYTLKGMKIYGVIVGILSACLYYFIPIIAIPTSIFIVSLIYNISVIVNNKRAS